MTTGTAVVVLVILVLIAWAIADADRAARLTQIVQAIRGQHGG